MPNDCIIMSSPSGKSIILQEQNMYVCHGYADHLAKQSLDPEGGHWAFN